MGLSQNILPDYQKQIPLPNHNKSKDQQELITKFSTPPLKNKNQMYIVIGGDIMLSRNIGYLNKQQGYNRIFKQENYNPTTAFSNCTIENCLLIFNLESLFHPRDNDIPLWWFDFKANIQNLETILQLRQDKKLLLTLSNNHVVNGGYEGITATQQLLSQEDIQYIGAGTSKEQSRKIIHTQQNNIKVCFWNYSYDGKYDIKIWADKISRNPLIRKDMKEDIEKMKQEHCDIKVMILHRGAEYKISPLPRQRTLAQELIDSGADLILWGHSHIPGEYEKYKGKYIFYSFWNFIFDQDRGKRAKGSEFDYIYDYNLWKKTTPTYISLLAWLKLQKFKSWVKIFLDQIEMSSMTNGVHNPLDRETYKEILQRIKS